MSNDIAQTIVSTLRGFSVSAEVAEIQRGAAVDRYALKLAPGVKVKQVSALADDIALAIGAKGVRVLAPIPGTKHVGIEVPAEERKTIPLSQLADNLEQDHPLRFPVGIAVDGSGISARVDKLPHLLVAGTTGSGKSVFTTALLAHLVTRSEPAQLQLMLVDPKRVELASFAGLPHLARPVATDIHSAVETLDAAVAEMETRWKMLEEAGKRQVSELADPPPYLVVVVDELADLMMTAGKRAENAIVRLLQLGRAAGVHLILATQRPSTDVVTGLIKTNAPSRMVFAVSSHTDSGVALGQTGAQNLLGQGDGLWWPGGASQPERIQGVFLSTEELEDMLAPLKRQETETVVHFGSEEPVHTETVTGDTLHLSPEEVRERMFARLSASSPPVADPTTSGNTPETAPTPEEPAIAWGDPEPRESLAPYIEEMKRTIREMSATTPSDLIDEAYEKGRRHAEILSQRSERRVMTASDWWVATALFLLGIIGGVLTMPALPIAAGVWLAWTVTQRRTRIQYNLRGKA